MRIIFKRIIKINGNSNAQICACISGGTKEKVMCKIDIVFNLIIGVAICIAALFVTISVVKWLMFIIGVLFIVKSVTKLMVNKCYKNK